MLAASYSRQNKNTRIFDTFGIGQADLGNGSFWFNFCPLPSTLPSPLPPSSYFSSLFHTQNPICPSLQPPLHPTRPFTSICLSVSSLSLSLCPSVSNRIFIRRLYEDRWTYKVAKIRPRFNKSFKNLVRIHKIFTRTSIIFSPFVKLLPRSLSTHKISALQCEESQCKFPMVQFQYCSGKLPQRQRR